MISKAVDQVRKAIAPPEIIVSHTDSFTHYSFPFEIFPKDEVLTTTLPLSERTQEILLQAGLLPLLLGLNRLSRISSATVATATGNVLSVDTTDSPEVRMGIAKVAFEGSGLHFGRTTFTEAPTP